MAAAFAGEVGRAPSLPASRAHDAARLVARARQWAAQHGGTRLAASRGLRGATLRDGVCGSLEMGADGEVDGLIEVLRVESGALEIYDY
jgi:hypothetical protein